MHSSTAYVELMDKTGRTAIHRSAPSLPLRWLLDNHLIASPVLDYGCGRGADVDHLRHRGYDARGWDPNHRPDTSLLGSKYATVLCTYVLNVVEDPAEVVRRACALVGDDGVGYFAVRRDVGNTVTQRHIVLDMGVIRETVRYCVYSTVPVMLPLF